MRHIILTSCAILAISAPMTLAQDYGEHVHLDVVEGWRTSGGTHMAAIRLTLDPGWKTYWRAPGDAGIPPSFEWNGAQNIRAVQFHWPTPDVFHQNGMRSVGYENQVLIPIELTPSNFGDEIALRGQIHIGVCEEICVPVALDFDALLPNSGRRNGEITAALLDRPLTAQEAGVRTATCRLDPLEDGISLTAELTMPSAGHREMAVIELDDPDIWVSEPDIHRQGNRLTATSRLLSMDGGSFAVDRSAVRITVLGSEHTVDIRGCTGG